MDNRTKRESFLQALSYRTVNARELQLQNCFIDDSETDLCQNGQCVPSQDDVRFHHCKCYKGWTGSFCNQNDLGQTMSSPFGKFFIIPMIAIIVLSLVVYTYHIVRYFVIAKPCSRESRRYRKLRLDGAKSERAKLEWGKLYGKK